MSHRPMDLAIFPWAPLYLVAQWDPLVAVRIHRAPPSPAVDPSGIPISPIPMVQ